MKWLSKSKKIEVTSAIVLMIAFLLTFFVVGYASIINANESAQEVFTFAQERIEIYDSYIEKDERERLQDVSDKMEELKSLIEEGNGRVDSFIQTQHLDAIVQLDVNKTVVNTWIQDETIDWKTIVNTIDMTNIVRQRLYIEEALYDVVSVNSNESTYIGISKQDNGSLLSLEALFINLSLPKNGVVVVQDISSKDILASNETDDSTVNGLLNSFSKDKEKLVNFRTNNTEWYGDSISFAPYRIYVFFPALTVFRNMIILLAIALFAYGVFWIGFLIYQNYMEQKNLEAIKKQYRIVDAMGGMYTTMLSANVRTGKLEKIKAPTIIKDRIQDGMDAMKVMETLTKQYIDPEYQKGHLEFVDIPTIPERLKYESTLAYSYKDTYNRWVTSSIVPQTWDEEGDLIEVLFLTMDTTEAKRKETEINKKLELAAMESKRANIAKTDFLRRMSHDIRTPINGIRGMLEIAEHYPTDYERQKECRKKIGQASSFLLELVNNVLDMNKLESGQLKLEHVSFDMSNILDTLNNITNVQAVSNKIDFSLDASGIRNKHVIGSPLHVQQVFQNIVTNAIKYTNEGGTVRVTCTELEDGMFEFICKDTGVGMSEEFQKKAFEPFSQEKNSTGRTYTGTGLGLTITKELVEVMSGTLSLESKLGEGTTFIIHLPLEVEKVTEEQGEETVGVLTTLKGKHILVAEDNEMNMEIIEFFLSEYDATITKAWDGEEAVNLFQQGKYDAVLMDVMMPKVDGLEATRRIRALESEEAKNVPIIAMSANAFHEDVERSIEAGMNAHLSKPVSMQELMETLSKFLK